MAKEEIEVETPGGPPKPSIFNVPMVLALVNTVVILAVGGLMVYTRFIFKRPAITEQGERERLTKVHEKPQIPQTPGLLQVEPFTVNIQSNPPQPKSADGTEQQLHGKLHYATVGFALVLRDLQSQETVEKIRPALMDKVLSTIGRKAFHELTTVQGRYILRNQLVKIANQLSNENPDTHQPLVTQLYFTQFIVQ